LLITRQFKNRWGLQSGLVYTSTQIGINPQKMYALQIPGGDIAYKFITSSGYAYIKLGIGQPPAVGDSITTSDAKHLLKHISVPLSVKYKMGKNKLTVSPTAGVEANFITSAKVEVGVDLASNREIVAVNKLNGIKTFYWSGIAGAEASYQLNKKLSVNIQPVFRFALSPITKENVVETFPYSFGIRAGVTIKF
jgi:Outer membrane protein beta-barrel domain